MSKPSNLLQRAAAFEARVADKAKRIIRFTGSDETADRHNSVVLVDGWKLEKYLANPVFLWCHDSRMPSIGKAVDVGILRTGRKRLWFDIEFAPREVYEFADTIFGLYSGGFLSAVSVGFEPTKGHVVTESEEMVKLGLKPGGFSDAGWSPTPVVYEEQELWELSGCPVPSNPSALVEELARRGVASDGLMGQTADAEICRNILEAIRLRQFAAPVVSRSVVLAEVRGPGAVTNAAVTRAAGPEAAVVLPILDSIAEEERRRHAAVVEGLDELRALYDAEEPDEGEPDEEEPEEEETPPPPEGDKAKVNPTRTEGGPVPPASGHSAAKPEALTPEALAAIERITGRLAGVPPAAK